MLVFAIVVLVIALVVCIGLAVSSYRAEVQTKHIRDSERADVEREQRALDYKQRQIEERQKEVEERQKAADAFYTNGYTHAKSEIRRDMEQEFERYKATYRKVSFPLELEQEKKELAEKEASLKLAVEQLKTSQSSTTLAAFVADVNVLAIEREYNNTHSLSVKKFLDALRPKIRELRNDAAYYKYLCLQYQDTFPQIREYVDDAPLDRNLVPYQTDDDWIPEEQYRKMPEADKAQLALERYIKSSKKTNWQVGRDYEMFVADWLQHQHFTHIRSFGIEQQLKDLGRDIIALDPHGNTVIVQCKNWSADKLIREKHIMQLYATAVEYAMEQNHETRLSQEQLLFDFNKYRVFPWLITTTKISDEARRFAAALDVKVTENFALGDFPRIKCNVGKDKERIYHLPFDQMYDAVIIEPEKGEFLARTTAEAVAAGFRRAHRHVAF